MSTIKLLALIFTFICVIQRTQVYAKSDSYYQYENWKTSKHKVALYMGCDIKDRFRYDSDFLHPNCNITVEVPNSYNRVERLTCNIDRPAFTNLWNLHYEISAVVNPNVVVLYGTGKNWAQIRIVHTRECRYRDVYIEVGPLRQGDFGTAEVNVTLYEDTFDVYYEDKHTCAKTGVCMATYDFSGRLLEEEFDVERPDAEEVKNKVTYVFAEQYGGTISLNYDDENVKLVLYGGQNGSKVLFDLPRQNVTVLSISTQKKLFGLCYRWNGYRKATCLQYDNQGNKIINASFYDPRNYTSFRVTNRYEGGFTAMATNCTINDCRAERDILQVEVNDKHLKFEKPKGFIPKVCRSRVGDKSDIERGFDYATYLNCKPSIRGNSYAFMFKSWCSEFVKCKPVLI